jgi:hypothetical protein
MGSLFQIVYASTASESFDRSALKDMLKGSVRRNAQAGITGLLLYKDGCFLQALEGEEPVVKALFANTGAGRTAIFFKFSDGFQGFRNHGSSGSARLQRVLEHAFERGFACEGYSQVQKTAFTFQTEHPLISVISGPVPIVHFIAA